jgi:very-short-patch-repair endonuclease
LEEADEVDHALRLQRLNVGFSRAKERIHFFHSMPLDRYRGAIAQAINHYINQREIAHKRPALGDTDPTSPMEAQVIHWLEQTRFVQMLGEFVEIDAQFELGAYLRQLDPSYRHPAYRVDFLMKVQAQNRTISIVIEYDGFREHFTDLGKVDANNHEDYYRPEDVERQKVLEGYGYRFLRINRFNLGRDPVKTLDTRLSKLAHEALLDARPHTIIEEVKDTAEALMSGGKKVCKTCGEVRDIEDFDDPELKHRMGRKCMHCKRTEAAERAQRAAGKAAQQAAKAATSPIRLSQPHGRRRYRRRW